MDNEDEGIMKNETNLMLIESWKNEKPSFRQLVLLKRLTDMPKNLALKLEMFKSCNDDIDNMSKWDISEWITKMINHGGIK